MLNRHLATSNCYTRQQSSEWYFCCALVLRGLCCFVFFFCFNSITVPIVIQGDPLWLWKLRDSITNLFHSLQIDYPFGQEVNWSSSRKLSYSLTCPVGKWICISGSQHRLNSRIYTWWVINQCIMKFESIKMDEVSQGKCILQNEKTRRLRGSGKHSQRRREQRKRNGWKVINRTTDGVLSQETSKENL